MRQANRLRIDALAIWESGVRAACAERLVREFVSVTCESIKIGDQNFSWDAIDRIIVVGFGKASGAMAVGLELALGKSLLDAKQVLGLVNVPEGRTVPTQTISVVGCRPPGENFPTPRVVEKTQQIIELVRSAGPRDLCICLISGGGSALLELPIPSVGLAELRGVSDFLSRSGASIYELNAVRSEISQVKGGRLAQFSGGAPIISLIISDVMGDDVGVIASGPTANAPGNIKAIDVLKRYDPGHDKIASTVWATAEAARDTADSTPSPCRTSNFIVGNIDTALNAARKTANELGYGNIEFEISGDEAETAGRATANQVICMIGEGGKRCRITGGETTVELCELPGKGGRNQHLTLAALIELASQKRMLAGQFCLLSGGTDGEDGNVPVAGAQIDTETVRLITPTTGTESYGSLSIRQLTLALERFDSHTVLSHLGCILESAPATTNVCDLRIVLTEEQHE